MGIEGDQYCWQSTLARVLHGGVDESGMSAVHTVKDPDGDDAGAHAGRYVPRAPPEPRRNRLGREVGSHVTSPPMARIADRGCRRPSRAAGSADAGQVAMLKNVSGSCPPYQTMAFSMAAPSQMIGFQSGPWMG